MRRIRQAGSSGCHQLKMGFKDSFLRVNSRCGTGTLHRDQGRRRPDVLQASEFNYGWLWVGPGMNWG